ncbi:MAG TPA: MalY/PatB family protein [Bacillota bacterium]|nr:MalY/PatB family protein [Bacillota bacterium]
MALEYIDRRGTSSAKWDGLEAIFGRDDLIAMWVADMDFATAEPVRKALADFVANVPFGYYRPPDSFYEAFIEWEKEKHGYEIRREWICTAPGVVSAFYRVLLMSTRPGDGVIVLTPCYYPMLNAVKDNDRLLVMSDLVNEDGAYRIDYEQFENDIIDNNVTLFIMSSPHNPVSRVWTREELRNLMGICRKHGVLVISDEIHQDFVWGERKHIPTATVGDYDDMLITMTALSKTFNLAACQNSFVIIPDEKMRARYKDFAKRIAEGELNPFGCVAVETAMREGGPWLEECRADIYGNYVYVKERLAAELPEIKVSELQGTYLLWMDFGAYFDKQAEAEDFLQNRCGVAFDYGSWFGGERFARFARMNLATGQANVRRCIDAIVAAAEDVKRERNGAAVCEAPQKEEEKNE